MTYTILPQTAILKSLDHKHIIKLFDTFEEPKQFLIITEIAEGGELFDRIVNKSKYTEKEARDCIKVMISTLAFIHGQGIVHRDLKPENLLLTSSENDWDLKFADFGFAKKVKDLQPKEVACGTPGYVAPEIIKSLWYQTEVDVWSMGVICYVLLCGYPPFYDEDQRKLFKKIKEGRYHFHEAFWSHISKEAVDLIKCMLTVDQKERWSAEKLLDHPWLNIPDESLSSKDLSSTVTVMRKFNARRRLKAAADAIILANRMKANPKEVIKYQAIDMKAVAECEEVTLDEEKHPEYMASLEDAVAVGEIGSGEAAAVGEIGSDATDTDTQVRPN